MGYIRLHEPDKERVAIIGDFNGDSKSHVANEHGVSSFR